MKMDKPRSKRVVLLNKTEFSFVYTDIKFVCWKNQLLFYGGGEISVYCVNIRKHKYRVIRESLKTHFIKSVHLNGGKDGCRASHADGAHTKKNEEFVFLYVGRT